MEDEGLSRYVKLAKDQNSPMEEIRPGELNLPVKAILILHVPMRFRSFSFGDYDVFVKKSDKGVNLLASLCDIYNTSEDDLRRILENANKLIDDTLKKKPQFASECKVENLDSINTDGLTYFDDLLDEKSLESNLLILEKDYDDAINAKGELDERIFINDEDNSLSTGSLSGGASNILQRSLMQ